MTTRARGPEAKDERRRQLKDAAREVFDGGTFAEVTMAAVVGRAGLAKGTIYLYYRTKEALFLEVLADELDAWFEALGAELPAGAPPEASAGALADTLVARPRLLRLLALLHAVLEENVDVDTAREFKTRLAERLLAADAELGPRIPGFGRGDLARLLLRTHALVVGLGAMASPSAPVAAVLCDPALAFLRVDLRAELAAALADWLRGWTPISGGPAPAR